MPTGSTARSSSACRSPASLRPRQRCSTASLRFARPSSITVPMSATSSGWSRPCWSLVRCGRRKRKARAEASLLRSCCRVSKTQRAHHYKCSGWWARRNAPLPTLQSLHPLRRAAFAFHLAGGLERLVLIEQLLLEGDQLLGFLQRLIQIAAQDEV